MAVYPGMTLPGFVVDQESVALGNGRQIDWAEVPATFVNPATGKKVLPAGLAVGETTPGGKIAPRRAADPGPPEVTAIPAIGLLATNAIEGDRSAALSGYGILKGGVLYTELLPAVLDATTITELQAAGTGFAFEHYADDRAS